MARHPCIALHRTIPAPLPDGEKPDPWNYRHWTRRTLEGSHLTFEGKLIHEPIVRGKTAMQVRVSVASAIQAITDEVSVIVSGNKNVVTGSAVMEMLVEWFVQHPPKSTWIKGMAARYAYYNRRGPKSPKPPSELTGMQIIEAGFMNLGEYESFTKTQKDNHARRRREILEERDFQYEDIAPVPEEYFVDGVLKIPKEDKWMLG